MRNGPYNLIVAPKDYPGKRYRGRYAYEHIVIYWQYNGCVPQKGYEIHHLDMDHRNNKIENLKLVTSSDHRRLHGFLLKEKHRIKTQCGFCLKKLVIKGRDYRFRIKINKYSKIFCSQSCGTKHQHSRVP